MFTGIVQAVGRISAVERRSEGVQVAVDAGAFAEKDVAVGDSIALNGCCLTVVAIDAGAMRFDLSSETLIASALSTWKRRCDFPTGWADT
jgi:riboflavin synthase